MPVTMTRPIVFVLAALGAAGCYRDSLNGPAVPVLVRLADGSSPTGVVDRVEVYVTQVAASTTPDASADDQDWHVIGTPNQRFDIAAIRPGNSLLAIEGALPNGTYRAVRLTLNTDSSRLRFRGGGVAMVRWPVTGEYPIHAVVERPVEVTQDGGLELVLDIQLEQSIGLSLDPQFDLTFTPVVRAVDATATGGVTGVVWADDDGDGNGAPLADAAVSVYQGDASAPISQWRVVTLARSDALGNYRIGFLLAGSYIVRVEAAEPFIPVAYPELLIVAGGESRLDVTLVAPSPGSR
jgi:hypothetical protein